MTDKACAFTGHRPNKLPWRYNETAEGCVQLKKVLSGQIKELVEAGITDFLSGMAEGTDTICSEIVLALRKGNPSLRLHCILPHRGQESKWSFSSQERYYAILEQANHTFWVSQDYSGTCMEKRNHYLVGHASVLLAVYNGTRRSGTGATVNYARKLGREIIVVDPLTLAVTHENGRLE